MMRPGSADPSHGELLRTAARRFADEAFAAVNMDDIATDAGVSPSALRATFPTKRHAGNAVLDYERASMRSAMTEVLAGQEKPLGRIVNAFEAVGRNLATDIVIRAGVRIAAESRSYFPERRLDPFETWRAFIAGQLADAKAMGTTKEIDVDAVTWLLVTAGIGAKELISFRDTWDRAERQMGDTARSLVTLITVTEKKSADT